jgi:hypothetical protein
MTNAQIKQQTLKTKLDNDELSGSNKEFAERIVKYDKKQLRSLSVKEYKLLTNLTQ